MRDIADDDGIGRALRLAKQALPLPFSFPRAFGVLFGAALYEQVCLSRNKEESTIQQCLLLVKLLLDHPFLSQ